MHIEELEMMIRKIIDQFVFPDGCLDLGCDEQELFIKALAQEILSKINDG